MPTVHLTASVYLFTRMAGTLRLGLIEHPRFGGLLIPGGHQDPAEPPADAALRETEEETGRRPRLIAPPDRLQLPPGYPHPEIPSPWWTVRMLVAPDGHHPHPHTHEDHQYVAYADDPHPTTTPAHPFHWTIPADLPTLPIPAGTRLTALHLFTLLQDRPETLQMPPPGLHTARLHDDGTDYHDEAPKPD